MCTYFPLRLPLKPKDCFILTYTANRATGLLWLLFLVIVHVLLLNLVLDTLVAAYTGYQEHAEEVDSAEAVEGIREAFEWYVGGSRRSSRRRRRRRRSISSISRWMMMMTRRRRRRMTSRKRKSMIKMKS